MKLSDDEIAEMWIELPQRRREKICKDHGFGDYRIYAQYLWTQFQPHTREHLKDRVVLENDANKNFDQTNTKIIIDRLRKLGTPTALQAADRLQTLEQALAEIRSTRAEPFPYGK